MAAGFTRLTTDAAQIAGSSVASQEDQGLTLIEILITVVLLSVAALFAASMTGISVRFTNQARDNTRVDSVIDQDFATLERAGFQYTYCTGSYTWDGRACGTDLPGSQNYYFPPASASSDAAAKVFESDCKKSDGSMTIALQNAINNGDPALGLSAEALAIGISRTAQLQSGLAHRILVTYFKAGKIYRQEALVPVVAYWCPDTSY